MGKLEVAKFWRDINCLYPFYDVDGGNYTKIFLAGGREIIDKRKTKTTLGELARFFTQDLTEVRKKYGGNINRKKSVPIPLHADLVFVPVKVRQPFQKDEGSIAYVNSLQVKSLLELKGTSDFKTEIYFKDETSVKTMINSLHLKALLQDSTLVKNSYIDLYRSQLGENLVIKEGLSTLLKFFS